MRARWFFAHLIVDPADPRRKNDPSTPTTTSLPPSLPPSPQSIDVRGGSFVEHGTEQQV